MLSWNASSGLPEENHLFEDLFHFHDVSMHLGGLNPLMRCHEPRKVPNLTARFKASAPLRLPHLHIPRRSVYQESPQFKHGRMGNDMNCMLVLVFYTSIQAFTLITTKVSSWGPSGRRFLVSVLGLTTSRDGFWVILPWHDAAEQTLSLATF